MIPQAIRTYESGGYVIDPQSILDRRFEQQQGLTPQVTPQPAAQQPSPGAAGSTTQPLPPQAIQTSPQQAPLPPALYTAPDDDDTQFARAQADDVQKFQQQNVYSPRGDYRELAHGTKIEQHPDWPQYQRAAEIFTKKAAVRDKDTSRMKSALDKMYSRMDADTKATNAGVTKQLGAELAKSDVQRMNSDQAIKLDAAVDESFKGERTQNQLQIDKGSVVDRRNGELNNKVSPLGTMEPDKANAIARRIFLLNYTMTPNDAARTLLQIGSPPLGQGYNGYKGRGAANYKPYGVDPLGNRLIETPTGIIRIAPKDYDLIVKARLKGHDELKKYSDDLQKRREEERHPGKVARAIDWLGNKVEGMLK